MLAEGLMRVSEIAREYGVTHSAIDCIAKGRTWRHVKVAPTAVESDAVDGPKHESISSDDDL